MVLVNFWRYPDPYQRFLIRIRNTAWIIHLTSNQKPKFLFHANILFKESKNTEEPAEKVGEKRSDTEAGGNMDADDPSIVNESESEDEEENEDQE